MADDEFPADLVERCSVELRAIISDESTRHLYIEGGVISVLRESGHAELVAALKAMVAEQVEYMTINNLGDPEKQHNVIRARAALSRAGHPQEETAKPG